MSPFAKSRLKEIGEYIAKEYPRTALKVVDEIFHSVDRLEQFPLSGRVVPEFDDPEIREVIHPPFRILYQPYESIVEILTVIHSRQLLTEDKLQE